MRNIDIKNTRFDVIDTTGNLIKVCATYVLDDESCYYYIYIPKHEEWSDKDYINEAKKIFINDYKSGKVIKNIKGNRGKPWLIASIIALAIAAVGVGGFFTYKYVINPEKPAEDISHTFTFNGEHCRINGSLEYTHDVFESDKNIQYTIVPDQEWKLPETIDSKDVKYDKDTGVITIDKMTKDITINVTAEEDPDPDPTYTVSFIANGGEITSMNPIQVPVNGKIKAEDKPTAHREGYSSVTWRYEDGAAFKFDEAGKPGDEVTDNISLYADWGTIEQFDVTFYEGDEGTYPKTQTVNYGDKPFYYTPTSSGHQFLGWYESLNLDAERYNFDTPITNEGVEIFAKWDAASGYQVTWAKSDGTILRVDRDVESGTTPEYGGKTPTQDPDFPYIYKFKSWMPEPHEVNSDQVYIAQFDKVLLEETSFVVEVPDETIISFSCIADGGTITVDWGDETSESSFDSGNVKASHTYNEGGEYVISIEGPVNKIEFEGNNYLKFCFLKDTTSEIPSDAFRNCKNLSSVILGDGVNSIRENAFANCPNLTSVSISESVNTIEDDANVFSCCPSLESIVIDEDNEKYTSRDSNDNNCDAIIALKKGPLETTYYSLITGCNSTFIPNNVVEIGGDAFYGSGITSIDIPDSVISIGGGAFMDCSSLVSVNISDNVEEINSWAFCGCSSLISIYIPESVYLIGGNYVFADCSSLKSIVVNLDNETYTSRDSNGNNCNVIIRIANNNLMYGCKNAIIPDSVTNIAGFAFEGSGIEKIVIPDSVTNIDEEAFAYCPDLASIEVDPNNQHYTSAMHLDSPEGESCNAIIDKVNIDAPTLVVGCENTIIPDYVKSIASLAFEGSSIENIVIPESITSIGYFAFMNCSSLVSVFIPQNVEDIGGGAFSHCSNLDSIEVDENNAYYTSKDESGGECNAIISKADNTLLAGCVSTNIPNYVTSIADYAFYGSEITSIDIHSNVVSIGDDAFSACASLISVKIGAKSFGSWAFADCPNLTSVTFSNNVETVGQHSFINCENLSVVDLTELDHVPTIDASSSCFRGDPLVKCYVKEDMVEKFKTNADWSQYADRIVPGPAPSI